ncbi:hypothetical protein JCM19000A_22610 [Silvimonas sp. JCM 19000]
MTASNTPVALAEPRLEQGRALLLAGLQDEFTFNSIGNIPALWQRFVPWMQRLARQPGLVAYGVCLPANANGSFEYMAGIEFASAADIPAELTSLQLAPQRYLVFTHEGAATLLGHTMEAIWRQWLPVHPEYRPVPAPTFERYGEHYDPQTASGDTEVWIPVE